MVWKLFIKFFSLLENLDKVDIEGSENIVIFTLLLQELGEPIDGGL